MDLASVVAALASVGVRVSGSTPNSSVQVDSSRACPTGLAGPELSGTINDPGQHFHIQTILMPCDCANRAVLEEEDKKHIAFTPASLKSQFTSPPQKNVYCTIAAALHRQN